MKQAMRKYSSRALSQMIFSIFFPVAAVLAAIIPNSLPAFAACSYPSQVLDLTNWKVTLPTGSSGSPTEIKQVTLASYTKDPFFHPNSTCAGVVFRAPVNGVTTSGSSYPRSELREMISSGKSNASWSTTSGAHSMFIDQAITSVPKTKRHVVAGQIHDSSDDVIVIRLEYPKLFVDINGKTGPTLDANYALGKRFTVQFVAANGKILIYYNGKSTPVYTLSKSGSGNYFKAGAYTQSNCSKETDCSSNNYGEVVIHNLQVKHQSSSSGIQLISSDAPSGTTTSSPAPTTSDSTATSPSPSSGALSFEAESGVVTAPMQIASSADASGGKYIVQTMDTGTGSAKYAVAIPATGQYQILVRAISPNGSSNSFYYALDGSSSNAWSLADTLTNWTWTNGPIVSLTQGNHTFIVKKRETNTKLDAFEFKPISANVSAGEMDGTKLFEAELGAANGGMRILSDDSSASGGKYVRADSAGQMSYKFYIPESGTYRLGGWIKAADGSSDSFYVTVDGKSAVTWALKSPTATWTYDLDDSHTFSLGAGFHTLMLNYREKGSRADRLIFVRQ